MSCKNKIKDQMNKWGKLRIPFIFIVDFELNKPLIYRLDEIDPARLLYSIDGSANIKTGRSGSVRTELRKIPERYEEYLDKFLKVRREIEQGNTYLLNLTCSTPVYLNTTLREIFFQSNAKFKLWFDEQFVCFSPETFVTIRSGVIRSFPMKGTIDAAMPDAARIILDDVKETCEHYTIVDLIRNDLNIKAENVRVERFRYIETIETQDKKLLQVSSEISGALGNDYLARLGDIVFSMLPAGSVSGAPKVKTAEIIARVEREARGYYTGVFGIFDGNDLASGVMIRFIEKRAGGFIYRSGGGITSFSDPVSEYNEMIDKIYVPVV
jgi:para-aminobenzoate synthetase component 1